MLPWEPPHKDAVVMGAQEGRRDLQKGGGWSPQNTQEMSIPAAQPVSVAACKGKWGLLLSLGTGLPFLAHGEGTGSRLGTARLCLTGCLQGCWARLG